MGRNNGSATRLWTPDGDVTTHQDIARATRRDMEILMAMHDVAQKFNLSVVCQGCDTAMVGKNASPNSRLLSVACKCREIRAEMHQGVIV